MQYLTADLHSQFEVLIQSVTGRGWQQTQCLSSSCEYLRHNTNVE